jgi:hypothetical protein
MNNLGRTDVERIVEAMLDNLSIEIKDGSFGDPDSRTVVLMHNSKELARTWFSVKQST